MPRIHSVTCHSIDPRSLAISSSSGLYALGDGMTETGHYVKIFTYPLGLVEKELFVGIAKSAAKNASTGTASVRASTEQATSPVLRKPSVKFLSGHIRPVGGNTPPNSGTPTIMSGFRLKPPEAKPATLQAAPVAAWVPRQAHSQMVLVSPSGQQMYMKERQTLAGGRRVSRVRFCRVCPLFFLGCGGRSGVGDAMFCWLARPRLELCRRVGWR